MIKNLKTKSLKAKSLKHKSLKHKNLSPKLAKGGALYTFNLTDTVGGLPLQVPLNGTRDGDCPASDTKDLGMVNYATKGGARVRKVKRSSKNRKSNARTSRSAKKRTSARKSSVKRTGKHARCKSHNPKYMK